MAHQIFFSPHASMSIHIYVCSWGCYCSSHWKMIFFFFLFCIHVFCCHFMKLVQKVDISVAHFISLCCITYTPSHYLNFLSSFSFPFFLSMADFVGVGGPGWAACRLYRATLLRGTKQPWGPRKWAHGSNKANKLLRI